jgi:hypothetical protein
MHIKTSIMLALLVAASCASVSLDGQWEYRSSYIDGSLDCLGTVNITGASGSYMDRGNIYALNGKSSFDGRVWIGSAKMVVHRVKFHSCSPWAEIHSHPAITMAGM